MKYLVTYVLEMYVSKYIQADSRDEAREKFENDPPVIPKIKCKDADIYCDPDTMVFKDMEEL